MDEPLFPEPEPPDDPDEVRQAYVIDCRAMRPYTLRIQTKGRATDKSNLSHRATSQLCSRNAARIPWDGSTNLCLKNRLRVQLVNLGILIAKLIHSERSRCCNARR